MAKDDDTIILRHGLAIEWYNVNPVLLEGEAGYETDTGKIKVGNGWSTWNALAYFAGDHGDLTARLTAHINSPTPHPVYDDGPSLALLYQNKKV